LHSLHNSFGVRKEDFTGEQFGQKKVACVDEMCVGSHQTPNLPNGIVCNLSKPVHECFVGNDYVHFAEPAFADFGISRALGIVANFPNHSEQDKQQVHIASHRYFPSSLIADSGGVDDGPGLGNLLSATQSSNHRQYHTATSAPDARAPCPPLRLLPSANP